MESRIPERERVHQALVDLIEKGTPYDLEFEILPLDSPGSRTIHSVAELVRDPCGKPFKVTGMVRDITARVEVQTALRESEEKYRSLFENMRDGMIIINLAENARDAMPRGGRLSIETRPVEIGLDEATDKGLDSYGSYALIRVAENGCGIPPENVPHVFEPFFTTKGTGEGTGMGLPTVFGILKQSKGDISVESAPGKGSVFTVVLPRVDAPESRREESSDAAGRKSAGEVILLVEGEESVRELIRSSLELGGFTVKEAENEKAAMTMLRFMEEPPDLLLTDVMMPEMSGRELAQGLRKLFPETPVCFMSGYTDETIERLELLESGASFIQKPFLPGELIEMVRRVIDGSRA